MTKCASGRKFFKIWVILALNKNIELAQKQVYIDIGNLGFVQKRPDIPKNRVHATPNFLIR